MPFGAKHNILNIKNMQNHVNKLEHARTSAGLYIYSAQIRVIRSGNLSYTAPPYAGEARYKGADRGKQGERVQEESREKVRNNAARVFEETDTTTPPGKLPAGVFPRQKVTTHSGKRKKPTGG